MYLTYLGYIIIPLSLIVLKNNPYYLLYLCVVLSGFSGSSVINFNGFSYSVQPAFYVCFLFMIYKLFEFIKNHKISLSYSSNTLPIFVFLCLLSTVMPTIITEELLIINVAGEYEYLQSRYTNLTQFIYLFFDYVVFVILVDAIKKAKISRQKVIDCYLLGIILVCIITYYQCIAFSYGLPFDEFFRTNPHGNIQGTRIYGPCIEASMLVYYLATGLPLILHSSWTNFKKCVISFSIIVFGVMSYSTTFLVAIFVWILGEIWCFRRAIFNDKVTFNKVLIFFVCIILASVAIIFSYDYLIKTIDKLVATLSGENFSGIERWYCFKLLIDVAVSYPILGIGFGSTRGKDLFSTWFANTGILGMSALLFFIASQFLKNYGKYNYLKIPVAMIWITMFVSVPEPYNLFIWTIFALIDSCSKEMKKFIVK